MRQVNILAVLLVGLAVLPGLAQTKAPADKDKTPPDNKQTVELTTKPATYRPTFSATQEVEGRTLEKWVTDLQHADPSVREKALAVIPAYDSASQYVKNIVPLVHDEDLGPKVKAIMALGLIEIDSHDVPAVVAALSRILNSEEQHAAKLQAALTLSRFGNEAKEAVPSLIKGANDAGSWQIRKASIIALRRIGVDPKKGADDAATRALCRAAQFDKAFQVRVEAVQALGFMDRPPNPKELDYVRGVLTKLATERNESEKVIALWAHVSLMALDKVTDEGLKTVTKNLTMKETVPVRGNAVLAMGTLGVRAKSVVKSLIPMLDDKDLGVAMTTCWAFVSIGDKNQEILDAMTKMLDRKDLDEAGKTQVKAAIEELKNSNKSEMDGTIQKEREKKEKEIPKKEVGKP
jgi:HEAT repeat protein